MRRNYILYYFMFILLILLFGCDYSNNNEDNKYNFYIIDNNAIILNSFNSSYSKGDKIVVQLKKIAGFESGLQINGKKASVNDNDVSDILEVEFDMPEEDVTITSLINDDDSFSNSNLEGKHKISIGENSKKMNLGDGQFSYFNPGDTIKITFLRETIEEEIIILEDGEYLTRFDKRLSKDKKYIEISYIMPDKDVTISAVRVPTLEIFEAFPELESLYTSKTINSIVVEFNNPNINKLIVIEKEETINRLNPHYIEILVQSPINNVIDVNNIFSITYYTNTIGENYRINLYYDDAKIYYFLIDGNYYYAGYDYSFIESLINNY